MPPIDTKYDATYTKERRGENVKMGEIIAAHTYLRISVLPNYKKYWKATDM